MLKGRDTVRVTRPPTLHGAHSVLLVDDDPTALSTLARTLKLSGHIVHLAESGVEALEILGEYAIDAIVADLHMPEMKGTDLLAQIRRAYPNVVRILLTADDSGAAAREAINRAEVHRYLTKPWEPKQIISAITEAIAERPTSEATQALLKSYESAYPGIADVARKGETYEVDPVQVAIGVDRLRATIGE